MREVTLSRGPWKSEKFDFFGKILDKNHLAGETRRVYWRDVIPC
jgi:hypothetical protein